MGSMTYRILGKAALLRGFVLCGTIVCSGHVSASLVVYSSEATFLASAGMTTFLDFDKAADGTSIANGATVSNQYQSLGVMFSSAPTYTLNALADGNTASSLMPSISGPNQVRTVSNTGGGGRFDVLFAKGATHVGMYFGDVQFEGSFIEVFGSSGQSLGTIDVFALLGDSPYQWKFLGLSANDAVARIAVTYNSRDYVTIDNFRFAAVPPPAVPEPHTSFLLLSGMGMLYAMRLNRLGGLGAASGSQALQDLPRYDA